ncbi:MAG: oligosaccharide flippase family protein, partial [Oscillospiraceae bacterium]|nr:oligosaccharide flippase family protein [Oscillospiraceae bacterium]
MSDNQSLRKKTISGALWKFGERTIYQIANFIVSIILARLLLPEDYGIIALVSVFITICDKLVVSGFATSLIQKKDADNLD